MKYVLSLCVLALALTPATGFAQSTSTAAATAAPTSSPSAGPTSAPGKKKKGKKPSAVSPNVDISGNAGETTSTGAGSEHSRGPLDATPTPKPTPTGT